MTTQIHAWEGSGFINVVQRNRICTNPPHSSELLPRTPLPFLPVTHFRSIIPFDVSTSQITRLIPRLNLTTCIRYSSWTWTMEPIPRSETSVNCNQLTPCNSLEAPESYVVLWENPEILSYLLFLIFFISILLYFFVQFIILSLILFTICFSTVCFFILLFVLFFIITSFSCPTRVALLYCADISSKRYWPTAETSTLMQ